MKSGERLVVKGIAVLTVLAVSAVLVGLFGGVDGLAQAAPQSEVTIALEGKTLRTVGKLSGETTTVPLEELASEFAMSCRKLAGNQVAVSNKDHKVTFQIGSIWAVVNGHEVLCTWVPVVEGDQVMVPLRFLLENLGFQVKWVPGRVDISPIVENPIVIGTVRERQATAALQIDIQHPHITGLDPAVQEPMNAFFANRTLPALEEVYKSEKDSETNAANGGHSWQTELVLNYRVAYNQKDLLSIIFDDYFYAGGAHGITRRSGYTVDIKTGTSYALKDLFKPGTDYVGLLSAEVKKQIEEQGLITLTPFTQIRDDQDFYIKDDALVIFFQQYELMPYAFGFPEFRVPLASLKEVLQPALAARDWAPAN